MKKKKYIGIDLFTGAGGLSCGLSQAGFDMKLGVEIDPFCIATLRKNHPNMIIDAMDIGEKKPEDFLINSGLGKGDIDLIAGGPPCQGFSESNRMSRTLNNPLNLLYKHFFKFVNALQPTVFLFENVPGLQRMENDAILNDILSIGKDKLKYQIQWGVVDACDCGVPQHRKRIIIIGTKKKAEKSLLHFKQQYVTVREALDDLPIIENGNNTNELKYSRNSKLSMYQITMRKNNGRRVTNNIVTRNNRLILKRYKFISPGKNWEAIPISLMRNYKNVQNCHSKIYYRLVWDNPSVIISNFRKNMLIHPDQDRGLSVREAARLQSFPDEYIFCGTIGPQQQQVANAVPPLLAKCLGINILKFLENGVG